MEETWSASRFTVTKYVKSGVERGYTVGGVDDVMQVLDDNCMQLQGMAGSRFVGPFLNTVQRWEQTLSLISEVSDCRVHAPILPNLFTLAVATVSCCIHTPKYSVMRLPDRILPQT